MRNRWNAGRVPYDRPRLTVATLMGREDDLEHGAHAGRQQRSREDDRHHLDDPGMSGAHSSSSTSHQSSARSRSSRGWGSRVAMYPMTGARPIGTWGWAAGAGVPDYPRPRPGRPTGARLPCAMPTPRVPGPPVSPAPPQKIGLTPAESTPRRPDDPMPPAGAPNVVAIVLDDTGFGHLGSFGSDIATPHLDALAAQRRLQPLPRHLAVFPHPGLLLHRTQPSRRRHGLPGRHPAGLPGLHGPPAQAAAALPRLLRDGGYSTLAVGKWHLTPRWQRSAAGPFDTWPLGVGFERHYGFLQGDANHWAPNLVCDNHYIEAPRRPEEGYHLSEDLADQAIRMVQDQQQAAPGKPFFLYFALGAMHSPHHVAPEVGRALPGGLRPGLGRLAPAEVLPSARQGVVPPGTRSLTPRPWVQGWDELRPTSDACTPASRRSLPAS